MFGLRLRLYLVVAATACSAALAVDLQVVHWNDVHARTTPASGGALQLCSGYEDPAPDAACYGGHARLATACQAAKASGTPTICMDVGDQFLGTVWDSLFSGTQNVDSMPLIPVDVMTLGNHEFDYGVEALAEFINAVPFPVLGGCNMDLSAEPALEKVAKWHVFDDLGGAKVGLLGYIASDTGALTSAGGVKFMDPMTAVPQCVADFQAARPDVSIIGLMSHAGVGVDLKVAALPGVEGVVDFIIGAHTHTPMFVDKQSPCLAYDAETSTCTSFETSVYEYPTYVGAIPVAQQFYGSKYAGNLAMTFDDAGVLTDLTPTVMPMGLSFAADGTPIEVDEDPETKAALAEKFATVLSYGQEAIVDSDTVLSAARPDIRVQEMPLGNLICDAMLAAVRGNGYNETETPLVCIANGGGIRADLPASTITYSDIVTVLPFGNLLEVVELTGKALKETLELAYRAADDLDNPAGAFAHLGGGLTVVLDTSKPAAALTANGSAVETLGSRIVSLQYNCEEVMDDQILNIATNDFLSRGGDSYLAFATAKKVLTFGPDLAVALSEHMTAIAVDGMLPESAFDLEGRIFKVGVTTETEPACEYAKPGPSPAPAPAPGGKAFTTLPFSTIEGPSIRVVTTGAASECNAACVAEPKCIAAVHFGGAKKCWLKPQPLSAIEETFKGYLKVLIDGTNYSGYNESDFVQQPRSTDPGALSIKGMSVGMKANSEQCERACFDTYNDKCIYSQLTIATKDCVIARDCSGDDCEDVRTYWKIGIRNFSRVYCKNMAYRAAWGKWTGSYPKGADPCDNVFL